MEGFIHRAQRAIVEGFNKLQGPTESLEPKLTLEERGKLYRIKKGTSTATDIDWLLKRRATRTLVMQAAAEVSEPGVAASHATIDEFLTNEYEILEPLNPDARRRKLQEYADEESDALGLRWPLPSKEI